jgi:hypothetical protein
MTRMIFKDSGSSYFAGTSEGQIWFSDPPQWPIMIDQRKSAKVRRMALSRGANPFLYVLYDSSLPSERVIKIWYDGTQWQSLPIADRLPQTYLNSNTTIKFKCIAVDPVDENIVYLATNKGVYRGQGTSIGWTWAPYNKNLPLVTVNDLISIPATKELRAGTFGRGFWTVQVTPASTAKITYPRPGDTPYGTQEINFRGYGVDYEGGMIPSNNLQWTAEYTNGSIVPFILGSGEDLWHMLGAGDYTIVLKATDSLGLMAVDSINLTVKHSGTGGRPTAKILSPADRSEFSQTDTITFTGMITDPEDGTLIGGWYSDRDGYLGSGGEIHVSLSMEGIEGPTFHDIAYTAADSDGNPGTAHITVIIVARQ